MGIGRFAFTPMLPLMVQEGHLDAAQASWLAAANYVGYFVGAVTASRLRVSAALLALASLIMIALSTAAMSLPGNMLWMGLRFVSGVCSAWVFVATSVWCLGALARLRRQDLGARVYSGVGAGIAAVGVYCLAVTVIGMRSQLIWLHLGLWTIVAAAPLAWVVGSLENEPLTKPFVAHPSQPLPGGTVGIVASYGIMGFGYILPATFLPELARSVVADPAVFGLAWPVFGATAAVSTLMAGPWMRRASRLRVWAVCQALMGAGALLPSLWLHPVSIVISAVLVGGTFMVITLAGVQEIRARINLNPGPWVGYLTAAFALGQIAGPVVSALLFSQPAIAGHALDLGLQASALCLFVSAFWLWRQSAG
nr:YbfB/YjiJ family MFS transporter [Pollutimonas bauzanensis]